MLVFRGMLFQSISYHSLTPLVLRVIPWNNSGASKDLDMIATWLEQEHRIEAIVEPETFLELDKFR